MTRPLWTTAVGNGRNNSATNLEPSRANQNQKSLFLGSVPVVNNKIRMAGVGVRTAAEADRLTAAAPATRRTYRRRNRLTDPRTPVEERREPERSRRWSIMSPRKDKTSLRLDRRRKKVERATRNKAHWTPAAEEPPQENERIGKGRTKKRKARKTCLKPSPVLLQI